MQFSKIVIIARQKYKGVACGIFKVASAGRAHDSALGRTPGLVTGLPQQRDQFDFRAVIIEVEVHAPGLGSAGACG